MKRVLVASILGLAASVVSSYGQATYFFDTYAAASAVPAGQATWTTTASLAPAGQAGLPVADNAGLVADLLWNDGTRTGDLGVAVPVMANNGNPGYISGGAVSFDNLWTGTALQLTIVISGPNGASGSLSWTEPAQTPGAGYETFLAMPQTPIIVSQVPEPATFALAGLGAAALLIFRKRQ